MFDTVQRSPLHSKERDFSETQLIFKMIHALPLRQNFDEMEEITRLQLSNWNKEVATNRMCLVWFLLPEIKNGVALALEALSLAPGGSGYLRAEASFASLQENDGEFYDAMEHPLR